LTARLTMRRKNKERAMTNAESKSLTKGSRVYWQGDAADRGSITETSWDAVTIAWDNGQVAGGQSAPWRYARNPASAGKAGYGVARSPDSASAKSGLQAKTPSPPRPSPASGGGRRKRVLTFPHGQALQCRRRAYGTERTMPS